MTLGIVTFAACSEDTDNPYAAESSVKVTASNLFFAPSASEGTVTFAASGSVAASSTSAWCTTTVEGDIVRVNVEQNNSIESRATTVVLRCGADSTVVPVLQEGISILYSDKTLTLDKNTAEEIGCGIKSNIGIKILSCPDWATARLENDSVKTAIAQNNTGTFRSGYIKIATEDGAHTDSIRVSQYDFDEDIAGSYRFYYSDESGATRSVNVTVNANEIYFSALRLSIPCTFDKDKLAFGVTPACYVGKSGSSFIYLTFSSENGYVLISPDSSLANYAPLSHNDNGVPTAVFAGTKSSGTVFNRFVFLKFSTQNFSFEENDGTLFTWYDPYLVKNV